MNHHQKGHVWNYRRARPGGVVKGVVSNPLFQIFLDPALKPCLCMGEGLNFLFWGWCMGVLNVDTSVLLLAT